MFVRLRRAGAIHLSLLVLRGLDTRQGVGCQSFVRSALASPLHAAREAHGLRARRLGGAADPCIGVVLRGLLEAGAHRQRWRELLREIEGRSD